MGGPRSQMQQMAIVEELYEPRVQEVEGLSTTLENTLIPMAEEDVAALELTETTEPAWEPDYIDKFYIGIRTLVPSWMILLCGIVGAVTLGCLMFKRQIKALMQFWGSIIYKAGENLKG